MKQLGKQELRRRVKSARRQFDRATERAIGRQLSKFDRRVAA